MSVDLRCTRTCKTWWLTTERPIGPSDSRVVRTDLLLRGLFDAVAIERALDSGQLRLRPGVAAWIEFR